MPTFEDCANCGELLNEHYGAGTDDKCVECNSAEQRGKARAQAAVPPGRQQDDPGTHADPAESEQRQQVRDTGDSV